MLYLMLKLFETKVGHLMYLLPCCTVMCFHASLAMAQPSRRPRGSGEGRRRSKPNGESELVTVKLLRSKGKEEIACESADQQGYCTYPTAAAQMSRNALIVIARETKFADDLLVLHSAGPGR